MPFILPMLAARLEDPRRLEDLRYSAEPKLDGQRVQLLGGARALGDDGVGRVVPDRRVHHADAIGQGAPRRAPTSARSSRRR